MCAIAGMIGRLPDPDVTDMMLDSMKRRGPDGKGVYLDGETALLHTRLAIIDPEGGAQPMTFRVGEETFVISYNGELYNTEEIRRELVGFGHSFRGHSDTEVLLHGYCQWGQGVLEKLNGIFSFAVWEKTRRRLFLARDRMGVKPLFYCLKDGVLVFASEIKTILASSVVYPSIDQEGISELILLGPGRTPGCGVFRDVQEIEPGHYAFFEDGKLTINQYWSLKDRPHLDTFDETVEKIRWLVMDAVRRQMVSDVGIGTFLSGGLDSSLITSICAENMHDSLPTFSVDYENNERYFVPGKFQPNADKEYIDIVKTKLKTDHHWSVLSPEQLVDTLEEATIARDLPGMADVDFSLLVFCGQIRRHVKVALSGECADEIFGGYPWYRDPEVRGIDGFPWAQNTSLRLSLLSPNCQGVEEYVQERYLETIRKSDILPENSPVDRRTKEMVNLNVRWFMQTLLDRKDRMSMFHGLEVRVPFCDHRIAEYMYTVPWELKDHRGQEKGLLRIAMEGVLPNEVLWRKKSPYPKTHDPKYAGLIEQKLKDILLQKDSPIYGIINPNALHTLFEEQPWPWYGQLMRRPQMMAYLIQIDYWLRRYKVKIL